MTKRNTRKSDKEGYAANTKRPERIHDVEYVYKDANGIYQYEVRRWGRGKEKYLETVHFERDENEELKVTAGYNYTGPILYRLPELHQADKTLPVWIAEGERDNDLLRAMGEIATTNPHGAEAWRDAYADDLIGRHVIIAEDNDAPGRGRSLQIRLSLRGKAASVSIVRFTDMPVGSDVGDFFDAGHSLEDLKARIEPLPPLIAVEKINDTVDAIEDEFASAKVEIFGRSDRLVRPVKSAQGEVMLLAMSAYDLRDYVSKHCDFAKYDAKGKLVLTGATLDMAQTLLARVGRWKFREISGVHTAPIVRRHTGDVMATPGFDEDTGLYLFLPEGPVHVGTTKEEATNALAALRDDILAEFPGVTPVDLSVMLAGLLTPLARPVIDVAPLIGVVAHTPGTGKSYLVDSFVMLAQGQKSTGLTMVAENDEENRKLLGTAALQGMPIVSLDNVNGVLRGDFLCQMVERSTVQPRVLGKSEAPRIRNVFSFFANGNNMYVEGDLTRRCLICNLDSGLERPETRSFKKDPVRLIRENRERYLGYALTILRAYILCGERVKVSAFNSFGEWGQMVREAIIWLGCEDPCKSVEAVREDDPQRAAMLALFAAWPDMDIPYSAGDLIKRSVDPNSISQDTPLRRALLQVAGDTRDGISRQRLGTYLAGIKRRPVDRRYIDVSTDSHSKTKVYSLKAAIEPTQLAA